MGSLRVLNLKALHGANYFSAGPVVIVRLDLGEYDEVFTDAIEGFPEKLAALLPSLEEHHCSPGRPGGFFERVREGTLLGHVVEHVAIELQTLAGMDVGYGKTRSTASPGVYNVVFRFLDEQVGIFAAKAAVDAVNALLTGATFDVAAAVDALVEIREVRLLGPSTQAVVDLATERGIPHQRLDDLNLVQLGTGRFQKRIRATVTSETSFLAVETSGNKYLTVRMLADVGVPVPETIRAADAEAVVAFQESLGAPIVVKPCVGSQGRGTTLGCSGPDEVRSAVARALEHHDEVVAQPLVAGERYRLLVIDDRLVAAAMLRPPAVVGDGVSSVARLLEQLNAEPGREVGDKGLLTTVSPDEETERILDARGYTMDTVLREGEVVPLEVSGSLALGGSSRDVTDLVHPANRMLAERSARALGLDVAGVDVIATDIAAPLRETGGVVIGVSAGPDFRMHLRPTEGEPRNVAAPFLDMLFPAGRDVRIPIIAVTGSRGSTTAVRLIDHCLRAAHYSVGLACAEGLFIGGEPLIEGDMTGFTSAAITLKDTSIDCAVLEVPVRTILDGGLGYGFADVGVVLNVEDRGEGFDEARCLEDLAYAKSVVAEEVYEEGWSVLSADSEWTLTMRERLYSRPVLFSRDPANEEVREHVEGGGRAAVLDGDRVLVLDREERIDVGAAPPGAAEDAVLGAVAALYAFGVSLDRMAGALASFRAPPAP